MLASSQYAHRALAAEKTRSPGASGSGEEAVSICLHAWVHVYQGSRREERRPGWKAVTRTEDACQSGLATEFATLSAERARAALPSCGALDARYHRNIPMLLNECTKLRGDRLAAAGAFNRLHESRLARPYDLKAEDLEVAFVQEDARFRLESEARARPGAAREWLAFLGEQSRSNVIIETAEGVSPDEAVFRGLVQRYVPKADGEYRVEEATVRQRWSRTNGFDFRLAEVVVTPFTPVPESGAR